MDDLSGVQTLFGSAGSIVIVGLIQFFKPTWSGLVPPEWETRGIPWLTLLLSAAWQIITANVMRDLGQQVTFTWWILVFLTILCTLSANGLYSGVKAAVRG